MTIRYTNADGESLSLSSSRPYFLTRVDGVGRIRQDIQTFKAPNQDGAFFVSSSADMRNITLEGALVATDLAQAHTLRERFLRVLSPKKEGMLQVRNRRIACLVEEAGFTEKQRERMPFFFVSLLCPQPFFESPEEWREELALWSGQFVFPLEISTSGMSFGLRQPSQIITVDNAGDVPCGMTIIFRALGAVLEPELMNMETGKVLRLKTRMAAGDEYHIQTHFSGKRVLKAQGSGFTNAFPLLDTDSSFPQLLPGRNKLRYGAKESMDLLEVSVLYRPLFLGV